MTEKAKVKKEKENQNPIIFVNPDETLLKETQEIRDSIEKSSQSAMKIFFFLISFGFFSLITIFSTTQKDFLLGGLSISLPILNVSLPLDYFYTVGPFILLVIQFYLIVYVYKSLELLDDLLEIQPKRPGRNKEFYNWAKFVFPWLLNISYLSRTVTKENIYNRQYRILSRVAVALMVVLFAPFVIFCYMYWYSITHSFWPTSLQLIFLIISLLTSYRLWVSLNTRGFDEAKSKRNKILDTAGRKAVSTLIIAGILFSAGAVIASWILYRDYNLACPTEYNYYMKNPRTKVFPSGNKFDDLLYLSGWFSVGDFNFYECVLKVNQPYYMGGCITTVKSRIASFFVIAFLRNFNMPNEVVMEKQPELSQQSIIDKINEEYILEYETPPLQEFSQVCESTLREIEYRSEIEHLSTEQLEKERENIKQSVTVDVKAYCDYLMPLNFDNTGGIIRDSEAACDQFIAWYNDKSEKTKKPSMITRQDCMAAFRNWMSHKVESLTKMKVKWKNKIANRKITINLNGLNLHHAVLNNIVIGDANLNNSKFVASDMTGFKLVNSDVKNVAFKSCLLESAIMENKGKNNKTLTIENCLISDGLLGSELPSDIVNKNIIIHSTQMKAKLLQDIDGIASQEVKNWIKKGRSITAVRNGNTWIYFLNIIGVAPIENEADTNKFKLYGKHDIDQIVDSEIESEIVVVYGRLSRHNPSLILQFARNFGALRGTGMYLIDYNENTLEKENRQKCCYDKQEMGFRCRFMLKTFWAKNGEHINYCSEKSQSNINPRNKCGEKIK